MRFHLMLLCATLSSTMMTVSAQSMNNGREEAASIPYQSAFDGYRPMEEVTNPPSIEVWREANETVAKIGGHAGVVKAGQPDGQGKGSGHAGHGGHGGHAMEKPTPAPDAKDTTSAAPAIPAKPSLHQGH